MRWHLVKTSAPDKSVAYYIRGVGSNLYLNLAGAKTTAGTNIEINRLKVIPTQKWQFVESNIILKVPVGPMIRIVSKGNKGLYLTVKGGSEADNTNIDVESQTKKTDQLWSMVPLGGGYYKMANVSSRNSVSVKSGKISAHVRTNPGIHRSGRLNRQAMTAAATSSISSQVST